MSLLKPGGKLTAYEVVAAENDKLKSSLILNGFTAVEVKPGKENEIIYEAKKPAYEVGSSVALKSAQPVSEQVVSAWKLDATVEDNLIEPDDLLDEEDMKKPEPESLRVCGTTGKRKACKDCSCGLAEELAGAAAPPKTSSCGSVSPLAFFCGRRLFWSEFMSRRLLNTVMIMIWF